MKLGKLEQTARGFGIIKFRDHNGEACSLQESSAAIYQQPGSSCLWLGCDDANPRVMVPGKGWQSLEMPWDYLANTRLHLNRKQVRALITHLKQWLETGNL